MLMDETGALITVMLTVAVLIALCSAIGFLIEMRFELKESERKCTMLKRHIAFLQSQGTESEEERHESYRREFEKQMKRNTDGGEDDG